MGILEVKNVGKRFGGLQALEQVNLNVAEKSCPRDHRPKRGGQIHPAELLCRKTDPRHGVRHVCRPVLLGSKPHEINQMGISRVFQTPEIFGRSQCIGKYDDPLFAKRDGAFRSQRH